MAPASIGRRVARPVYCSRDLDLSCSQPSQAATDDCTVIRERAVTNDQVAFTSMDRPTAALGTTAIGAFVIVDGHLRHSQDSPRLQDPRAVASQPTGNGETGERDGYVCGSAIVDFKDPGIATSIDRQQI